jgi:hypothetical protein
VEQDAKELLSSVSACIEEVAKKLDQKNIKLDRIKVESMDLKSYRTAYRYASEFLSSVEPKLSKIKGNKGYNTSNCSYIVSSLVKSFLFNDVRYSSIRGADY